MKRRVELDQDERITLQTLIVREIKQNKEYKEYEAKGLIPCFKTEYLEELYQKIAGYKYEGW